MAKKFILPEILPIIPLRNMVVFPRMIVPLFVGRDKSVKAVESCINEPRLLVVVSQKNEDIEDPVKDDLYTVGTLVEIVQIIQLPDGTTKALIEGIQRIEIQAYLASDPYFRGKITPFGSHPENEEDIEELVKNTINLFEQYVKTNKNIPPETLMSIVNINEPDKAADLISSYLEITTTEKQELLATALISDRLKKLGTICQREYEKLEVDRQLHGKVKIKIEKIQKEYYLKEKLRAIQEELGSVDSTLTEVEEYKEKIRKAGMPKDVQLHALKEVHRFSRMNQTSAEAGVIRTYMDTLIEVPWKKKTKERLDINAVEKILDEDHYGLEKVKERILEYFAVFQLTKNVQGSILCLVGPPGVGKTSVGRSIARAMNREFVRISLGGVRDEAELRGHRRTYVGAMPGRIIRAMQKAKVRNPIIILDEIDKLSETFKGDPAAALLEILDPEQNKEFSDNFLEVQYDLSNVIFITTANDLSPIPRPLLDRMEVIKLSGYTEDEKMEIAKLHLLPRLLPRHGIKPEQLIFTNQVLTLIIREYTKELGLRNLERAIAAICRKTAKAILDKEKLPIHLTPLKIRKFLGKRKYNPDRIEKLHQVGLVTGLAWTQVGGDTLPVEVTVLRGRGTLTLTGQLGEVMQESAQAAMSFVRSRVKELNIDENFYRRNDIHIHVSEGAIPKDGPSAGITMAVALISALTGLPVRNDVAMTGEITLRGRVLAIGGLKEKVLAAQMIGIKTVIIPKDNLKDLDDIPAKVRRKMKFVPVEHIDEALEFALIKSSEL